MANDSNDSHGASLLPTYNARGQRTRARLRQAYIEDVEGFEDFEDKDESRYCIELHGWNRAAATEILEWHGIALTPMLGKANLIHEAGGLQANLSSQVPSCSACLLHCGPFGRLSIETLYVHE